MKRLLLPLFAAIALPTAVNANWFSGDIVETNAIGEKTIVKKGTIRLERNTVNSSYEGFQYLKNMNDRFIIQNQKYLDDWEAKYAKCLAAEKRSWCDGVLKYPKTIKYYKDQVEKYKLKKKENAIRYDPILKKYENWTGTGNEVLSTTIYYTPIFEDINKKKTILQEEYVDCGNLSIDFSSLGITDDNEGLTSLERKICNKYAKF